MQLQPHLSWGSSLCGMWAAIPLSCALALPSPLLEAGGIWTLAGVRMGALMRPLWSEMPCPRLGGVWLLLAVTVGHPGSVRDMWGVHSWSAGAGCASCGVGAAPRSI